MDKEHRRQNICTKCNKNIDKEKEYLQKRRNCKECFREKCKKYYKKYNIQKKQKGNYLFKKSAVIFAYGNECYKCLENDFEKLIIEHKSKNRKIIEYLYNNKILDGYKVICINCFKEKNIITDKYTLEKRTAINLVGGKFLWRK